MIVFVLNNSSDQKNQINHIQIPKIFGIIFDCLESSFNVKGAATVRGWFRLGIHFGIWYLRVAKNDDFVQKRTLYLNQI